MKMQSLKRSFSLCARRRGWTSRNTGANSARNLVLDFEEALVKNKEYFDLVGGKRVKIKEKYLYVQNHILMDFLK